MITPVRQCSIEKSNEVQSFQTSIDPKNISHILTLLSSNLYSNPLESFFRETVANAWDSQVEAGTTDMPIIITLNPESISIRDYGTGLSPERFREIYLFIGSSTKRESNDYIGNFGIGRFAALACTNTVFITSYYEGTEYKYVMVKENNNITINLLTQLPTTEKNGVDILINRDNSKDYYNDDISSAIWQLDFIPNLYVQNNLNGKNYNDKKIKDHTYYKVCSEILRSIKCLLLGNILYPMPRDLRIPNYLRKFARDCCDYGIAIKFDIGELTVTPNREEILCNEQTTKIIEDRLQKAYNEFYGRIPLKPNFNDFHKYIQYVERTLYYDAFTETFVPNSYSRTHLRIDRITLREKTTYKNKKWNSTLSDIQCSIELFMQRFVTHEVSGFVASDGTKNIKFKNGLCSSYGISKPTVLYNTERVSPTMKEYIKDTYFTGKDILLARGVTKQSLLEYVKKMNTKTDLSEVEVKSLIDEVWNSINVLDLESKEYKDYLEANKAKPKRVRHKDIVVRIPYSGIYHYDSYEQLWHRYSDCPVVVATNDQTWAISLGSNITKLVLVVNAVTYREIRKSHPENVMFEEDLLKHPKIRMGYTKTVLSTQWGLIGLHLNTLHAILPKNCAEELEYLQHIKGLPTVRTSAPVLKDPYVEYLINKYSRISDVYDRYIESYPSQSYALFAAVKDKALRISVDTYKSLIQTPFINRYVFNNR